MINAVARKMDIGSTQAGELGYGKRFHEKSGPLFKQTRVNLLKIKS